MKTSCLRFVAFLLVMVWMTVPVSAQTRATSAESPNATLGMFAKAIASTDFLALEGAVIAAPGGTHPPSWRRRVDVGLGILSMSGASMALAFTATCTKVGTCEEVNPIMKDVVGAGTVTLVVTKTIINGVLHYVVWRFVPEGNLRTGLLTFFAGVNGYDGLRDLRITQQIERRD